MTANKKDEVLSFILGLTEEMDESGGVQTAADGIEKNLARAGVAGEEIKAGRRDLAHIAACITAASLEELRGDSVGVCVARFTDVIEKKFQNDFRASLRAGKRP